jgi:hypothetical protein
VAFAQQTHRRIALEIIRIVHECEVGMRNGVRYFRANKNIADALTPGPDKDAAALEATNQLKRAVRLPYRVESRLNSVLESRYTVAQLNNALALVSSHTVQALRTELQGLQVYSETLRDRKQNQGWTEAQVATDMEASLPLPDQLESVPIPLNYVDDF